jgi:hypothetical protein
MEMDGTNAPAPLLVNQDTTQGVVLRDALLPPTTLAQQIGYVPAWSPERHRRRRPVWIGADRLPACGARDPDPYDGRGLHGVPRREWKP